MTDKETKLAIIGFVLMYVPWWPFPAAGFILLGIAVVRVWIPLIRHLASKRRGKW